MLEKKIKPAHLLKGQLRLGGDKSISHRALILSSISKSRVKVKNFYPSQDCLHTLLAMRKLGAKITTNKNNELGIQGVGLNGLACPKSLFLGDSGTTYRLLAGLLSGNDCLVLLKAGDSLSRRPMKRIVEPLARMGAKIKPVSRKKRGEMYPPLMIKGGKLKGITYRLPIASAQVKSAVLLAALYADGRTQIIEDKKSRDHTERMLERFKARIKREGKRICLDGPGKSLVAPKIISIPGDFSSAAFFIVGALLLKGSSLVIRDVNVNPTRIGLLKVLKRMNAKVRIIHKAGVKWPDEPVADIEIEHACLKSTVIEKNEVPLLIDEVPILMVAASLAKGKTIIRGVSELRVKETDRIKSMVYNLKKMGALISNRMINGEEEIVIQGVGRLKGAALRSFSDHRTAMSVIIASLCADSPSLIDDTGCINKSFPDFLEKLESVKKV